MKKIFFTVTMSAFIIFGLALADYTLNGSFVTVSTDKVRTKDVISYVNASGVCEEQNKREIRIDLPFEVEKVFVKEGDKIGKGQKLLTVNKEPLCDKLMLQSLSLSSTDNSSLIAKINNYNPEILSPISGIVTRVLTYDGAGINPSAPLLVISDLENLIIKASVPEGIICDVYEGQKVIIAGEALDGKVTGRVDKIHPAAIKNEITGENFITVDVIADSFDEIIPGTTLDLSFEKTGKRGSVVIPFGSVKFNEEIPYVFINNGGYAVKRQIGIGEEFDTEVEVTTGLYSGDELILNPDIERLKEGDKILSAN